MSGRALTLVALLALGAFAGCECEGGEGAAGAATDPAPTGGPSAEGRPASDYFPLKRGDRWRVRAEPGLPVIKGVTGIESGGTAVVATTGQRLIERYRAGRGEVALVDPEGAVLVPILRAPLKRGSRWTYRMAGPAAGECEARIVASDARHEIGTVQLEACVDVERVCTYSGEGPGPRRLTQGERYCPALGLVQQRIALEPPPPQGPGELREALASWRIDGAPVPPDNGRFDCADFLLLPTDVRAACGTELQGKGLESGASLDRACAYEYEGPGGTLRVSALRIDRDATDQDVLQVVRRGHPDAGVRAEGETQIIATGDRMRLASRAANTIFVVDASPAACSAANAQRLLPLLRSLVTP